jgi:peroxiredoxin
MKFPLQAFHQPAASTRLVALSLAFSLLAGCRDEYAYDTMIPPLESVESQALEDTPFGQLQFVDSEGQPVLLDQFRGKNVVLVMTRGYLGSVVPGKKGKFVEADICLYCASQTSSLVNNYAAFQERGSEVLVVFPVAAPADNEKLKLFRIVVGKQGARGEPPFPLLLDVELKAVDRLGIRDNLAKPATYILDKQGQLRFAYVGSTLADRPSPTAILSQLDRINGSDPEGGAP